MGNMLKIVMGIMGVIVLFIMFPMLMSSTHELQTDEYTDSYASAATGAGVTTYSANLTKELWDDDLAGVIEISSTNSNDVPAADSYTPSNQVLVVKGLEQSSTRDIEVTYEYDALTTYTGMGAFVKFSPLLIFVAIIFVIIGGIYAGMRGRG